MNPNARYAIVPVHYGDAPADAIMVGPLPMVMENIPDAIARHDSLRTLQSARLDAAVITQAQKATRALQIAAFADSVDTLIHRMDALEPKRAKARAAKAKADAAREQKEILDYLDGLPNPDDPPASHFNTGDLSPLPPTNTGDDNEGDLPKDLLRATPPSPGNYPLDDPSEMDVPSQPKYRNPAAVSLNEADD
jgi:hypothetical protein